MTDLLECIERYLRETGTAPAVFGREVMRDPNFVFDLRDGRDYRRTTAEKVMDYISKRKDAA